MKKTLLKQASVCDLLDISRSGLIKLAAKDRAFPKPLKFGDTKQSPVFYDATEIYEWIESKKAARMVAA